MIASSLVGALDVLWNARRRAASLSLLPSRTPYARVKRSIFALARRARLAERIDVYSLNAIGLRLYKAHVGQATIASREVVREAASAVSGHKFGQHFLLTEWEQVVDAWQLENWRLTEMLHASAERLGSPRHNARFCGRSSSAFVPGCNCVG